MRSQEGWFFLDGVIVPGRGLWVLDMFFDVGVGYRDLISLRTFNCVPEYVDMLLQTVSHF